MGIIKIFFLLPSKGKFLQNFANNDQLKAQAEQVTSALKGGQGKLNTGGQ